MADQPAPDLPKSELRRQIRVFVSSTFRDMYDERNYLVTHIFPQLRKLCAERGVTWGEVDLRWGINDEQKAEGKVLPICLDEIKRCKPYFIGLLGERYGWVPDAIPDDLIDREPWLKEHTGKTGKSVTELEILHGVLNNPEMAQNAFFYFRDPAYIKAIPQEKQKDFTAEGAEDAEKLKRLKEKIRRSKFPVREHYPDPKALGALVLKDLSAVIEKLYPKGSEPHPLDRDAMEHDAFAQSRAKVYIGRKEYFDRLDGYIRDGGTPMVILGESGSGKSALIANWALQYREQQRASLPHQKTTPQSPPSQGGEKRGGKEISSFRFPPSQGGDKGEVKLKDDLVPPSQGGGKRKGRSKATNVHHSQGVGFMVNAQSNDKGRAENLSKKDELIIMHFIGATPYSADWAAMVRRIMGELKRRFDIQGEIPDKPDALRLAFANWLHMVPANVRVVLILDALNQLEDRDGAPDLVWLPPVMPANIRLIVSTITTGKNKDFTAKDAEGAEKLIGLKEQTRSRPLEELKRRGWQTLTVEPLTQNERRKFIQDYLKQYTKELNAGQTERVATARQTENPLYMRALLEELRLFGKHEELDKKIDYYLEAQDPYEIYEKIIIRWEDDYEGDSDLVGDSMSLLWASRRGLSEGELLEALGKEGKPMPQAIWAPLYLAAEDSLVNRSGLLGFFHDYLRDAIRDAYMPTEELQQEAHLRLADYFEKKDKGLSVTDEVHKNEANVRHPHLTSPIGGEETILPRPMREGLGEGSELPDDAKYREVMELLGALSINPRTVDELPWQLSQAKSWERLNTLLADLPFFEALWDANKYELKGYWSKVEDCSAYRMVEAYKCVLKETKKYDDYIVDIIAALFQTTGHTEEAMRLREHQVTSYRESGNLEFYSVSLGSQAVILQDRGELDEAMRLHKEQERICRELGNKDGLQASLGNQAVILQDRGELDEAMRLMKEQERICRELGNKNGIQASLGNQALILKARGELDEAMRLLKEKERICRELGDKNGLSMSLGNQAHIHYARGELDEAMRLLKEEERICRELGNKNGIQASLGNQALILKARGELDESMRLMKEQERICRELGNKNGLSMSLGNQALILKARGELDESMRLMKEKEHICRELGNKQELARGLANQAILLYQNLHRVTEAQTLVREAYAIATSHGLTALAQWIKPIFDTIHNANSTLGKDAVNKKSQYAAKGNIICPNCGIESKKGSTFCVWCKTWF